MQQVWGERARVVATSTADRVDAIEADDHGSGPDVWLTWQLEPTGGGTRLRLVLDELDRGPDPAAELREVLGLIEQHAFLCHPRPSFGRVRARQRSPERLKVSRRARWRTGPVRHLID